MTTVCWSHIYVIMHIFVTGQIFKTYEPVEGDVWTCQYFHLYRNGKTLKTGGQKKKQYTFTLECIFHKIGPFSNFHYKQKVTNKWPCVAYRKNKPCLRLQFKKCKSISSSPQEVIKNVPSKKKTTSVHIITPSIFWKIPGLFKW